MRRGILAASMLLAPLQPAQYVGRIDAVTGRAGQVVVRRSAGEQPAMVLQPLRANDVVVALAAGASATLRLADGTTVRVCGAGHPECRDSSSFRVPAAAGANRGMFAAVRLELSRWLGTLETPGRAQAAVDRGDGDELEVPIWRAASAVLDTGQGARPLVWLGGTAPYVITISAENGAVLYRHEATTRQVDIEVPLTTGRYRAAIRESGGERRTIQLEVRALPDSLAGADPLARLAHALAQTGVDGGVWVWESFARIGRLRDQAPLASGAYAALARGKFPP